MLREVHWGWDAEGDDVLMAAAVESWGYDGGGVRACEVTVGVDNHGEQQALREVVGSGASRKLEHG